MADFTPGDIRAKIHELVGNPDAVQKKPKTDRHRYYKRPGRGHNRDNCDACGDVGDILCCDTCPASFHWDCVDPPMEEEDLPEGGWQCRACIYQNKARNGRAFESGTKVEPMEVDLTAVDAESVVAMKDLFKKMIEYWKAQNPREFKLPKVYGNFEPNLPGYSKSAPPAPKKGNNKPKNVSVVPDSKTKKRTACICFVCSLSSRTGALIQCDSCEACFHLTCLDPPLATVPSGIWYCPLHPEFLLEAKYLKSSSLSERVRIWDHSQFPLEDPVTVTLNFAAKAHSARLNNVLNLPEKPNSNVPEFVVGAYSEFRKGTKRRSDDSVETLTIPEERSIQEEEVVKESFQDPELEGLDVLLQAIDLKSREDILDSCLKDIHPQMVKLMAAQKLAENPSMFNLISVQSALIPKLPLVPPPTQNETTEPPKPTRLTPSLILVHLNAGKIMEFQRRSIDVGLGGSYSLDLSKLGSCERVSTRHATIYYDQIRSRWELLNYGEYGTLVNGVVYGCDISHYANINKPEDETLRHFKQVVDQRKKTLVSQRSLGNEENLGKILKTKVNCLCAKEHTVTPTHCWEGHAFVNKGDKIQMGCHRFVVANTSHVEHVTLPEV